MSHRCDHATPRQAIDVCEASVRDIADGNLFDARDFLSESQHALDTYVHKCATVPTARAANR